MLRALKISRHSKTLRHSDVPRERLQAAAALGDVADERAAEPLVATLTDSDSEVRKAAAAALDKLGWGARNASERALHAMAWGDFDACLREGEAGFKALLVALKDRDTRLRCLAAKALGKLRDPRAVEPLCAALSDPWSVDLRCNAARALRNLADSRAVESLLMAMVKDREKQVQQSAASALQSFGRLAVPPLSSILVDSRGHKGEIRKAAAAALGNLADPRAVEPLIAALTDTSPPVRMAAAAALRKLADLRAVEPLIAALTDTQTEVCKTAAAALDKLGWRAKNASERARHAMACGDFDAYLKEFDACVKDGHASFDTLVVGLNGPHLKLRCLAANALGKLGDARAVAPLVSALRYPTVRESAANALEALGGVAVKPLISLLRNLDFDVQQTVLRILGNLGDRRATDELITFLRKAGGADNKIAAIDALGILGDPWAVVPLLGMPAHAGATEEALRKLGALTSTNAEERALSAIARGDFDACAKEKAAAIKPLIATLESFGGSHVAAAETMVRVGKALIESGDPRGVTPLIALLSQARNTDSKEKDPLYQQLKTARSALQKLLEKSPSLVNSADLESITALADLKVRTVYHDLLVGSNTDNCLPHGYWGYDKLDLSHLRQLARQESIRRESGSDTLQQTTSEPRAILAECRCGQKFRVRAEYGGMTATCPKCNGKFVIPGE